MAEHVTLHRGNVAVVIPALNESLRIREVVDGALAQSDLVIVVDDGSDDDTAAIVAQTPAVLLRHAQRMGKGRALRDGFAEALRHGMAAVVTMDGDGQHRARDIPRLIAAANRHPRNIVNGARLQKRSTQPWYRRIGNDFGGRLVAANNQSRIGQKGVGRDFQVGWGRLVFEYPPGEIEG